VGAPGGSAQSLTSQASRAARRSWPAREAIIGLGRGRPCGQFWPVGRVLNEIPFPFQFGLNSSLNMEIYIFLFRAPKIMRPILLDLYFHDLSKKIIEQNSII
jgi:hypothetical protein